MRFYVVSVAFVETYWLLLGSSIGSMQETLISHAKHIRKQTGSTTLIWQIMYQLLKSKDLLFSSYISVKMN